MFGPQNSKGTLKLFRCAPPKEALVFRLVCAMTTLYVRCTLQHTQNVKARSTFRLMVKKCSENSNSKKYFLQIGNSAQNKMAKVMKRLVNLPLKAGEYLYENSTE